MEKASSSYRCFWNYYPNHDPVRVCTMDKKDWFEKVDLEQGVFESGLCISSVIVGQPAGCVSYAKWFVDSVKDILK